MYFYSIQYKYYLWCLRHGIPMWSPELLFRSKAFVIHTICARITVIIFVLFKWRELILIVIIIILLSHYGQSQITMKMKWKPMKMTLSISLNSFLLQLWWILLRWSMNLWRWSRLQFVTKILLGGIEKRLKVCVTPKIIDLLDEVTDKSRIGLLLLPISIMWRSKSKYIEKLPPGLQR
jgi:hypothetical protein